LTRYLIGAGGWAYFQVLDLHPLVAYSKAFNFVEVNSTFYEIPSLKLVESWRRLVPPNFEFAVRCNKALTHKFKFQLISDAFEILERCGLKKAAKVIDVDLRNSIAHLDFEINEKGKVSAKSQGKRKKEINIYQKINEFIRKWMMITFMLNEVQESLFGTNGKNLRIQKKRET
jgi:hypothetical protein